jgi:hypothetical protein
MTNRYRALVCAIISLAIDDIKKYGEMDAEYISADKFFRSDWFRELADESGIHPDKVLAMVHQIKRQRNAKFKHKRKNKNDDMRTIA